ncbi:MAG: hypothetical protein HZA02_10510 [Nitrospinae bacterium]|nr:hypothetical protein [Nitrospinota bacterium]
MIDGIDYFPKRDQYKKKKKGAEDDWNALKKVKTGQESKKGKAPRAENDRDPNKLADR